MTGELNEAVVAAQAGDEDAFRFLTPAPAGLSASNGGESGSMTGELNEAVVAAQAG
ncbi:hypothetical protein JNW88_31310, partial [Micromonospora sp. ATA32]|nr:hypothetical protein [Micromonospora sp. ATA32]